MWPFRTARNAVIQFGVGEENLAYLAATRELHAAYCARHGIKFIVDKDSPANGRPPHWRKVELLIDAMRKGYDRAVWLDGDCIITDHRVNIFEAAGGFGIGVCECFDSPEFERHLNCGVVFTARSPEVTAFLDIWNAQPTSARWAEQDPFNELMATRPHRDLLTILPNRFNSVPVHMDARDPIIRAYHGLPDRLAKIRNAVASARR
jgi:hypothetical protein